MGNLRYPFKILHRGVDINLSLSIVTNIIKQLSNKIIPLLSSRNQLCSKISRIFSRFNVPIQAFTPCHCLSDSMVTQLVGLFLRTSFRPLSNMATDMLSPWISDGPANGTPIKLNLYLKPPRPHYHYGHKLSSKHRSFNCSLFL